MTTEGGGPNVETGENGNHTSKNQVAVLTGDGRLETLPAFDVVLGFVHK